MARSRRQTVPPEPSVLNVHDAYWYPWIFIAAIATYLFLFYWANELHWRALPLLLAPDVLIQDWVGNDWSRFGLLDHVPILLAAAVILVVAFVTGMLLLDALRVLGILRRLEQIVLATAVGLNCWSLFTLAVGLAGYLQRRWVFAVAALIVIGAASGRAKHWWQSKVESPPAREEGSEEAGGWLGRLALWLAIPFAVLIVWGGTLPPTHFDAREYHLQVPKEWFLQGHVSFLPHNVYGNMPLGAEMHAILGMVMMPGPSAWWWGALVGKTLIAAMAPLTALSVYVVGRRYFGATAGAVAAFVLISTPLIAFVSMNGLIDGAFALYFLLAVFAALLRQWRIPAEDKRSDVGSNLSSSPATPSSGDARQTRNHGLVALSGFLAGAAVACKYPALLYLVVPLFVLIAVPSLRRVDIRAAVIYVVAVLAGCGLWFGKNWVLTGNPTYPLLYRWFDGRAWTTEKDARWTRVHGTPYGGSLHAFSPSQLWNSIGVLSLQSDHLSPALWPLAVAACFSQRHRRRFFVIGAFMLWTAAVWWLLTHRVDRFLVPLFPLAALLAGASATVQNTTLWRRVLASLLVWCFAANFVVDGTELVNDNRLLISVRELHTDIPHPADKMYTRIHHAHRYLNEHIAPGYRALLVGDAQVFDLEVPVLYNTCFDDCIFEQLMRGRSHEEQLAVLREHRISHIFFLWRELDRYRSPGNYGYSEFASRELVRFELAERQGLLRRVPLEVHPDNGEVYEVVGWQDWK